MANDFTLMHNILLAPEIMNSCGNQCDMLNDRRSPYNDEKSAEKCKWTFVSIDGRIGLFALAFVSFLIGGYCLTYMGPNGNRITKDTMLEVLPSTVIHVPSLTPDAPNPVEATLFNSSTEDIVIQSVDPDCGCTSIELPLPHVISPRETLELRFLWTVPPSPLKQERSVLIKYKEGGEVRYGFLVFRGAVGR